MFFQSWFKKLAILPILILLECLRRLHSLNLFFTPPRSVTHVPLTSLSFPHFGHDNIRLFSVDHGLRLSFKSRDILGIVTDITFQSILLFLRQVESVEEGSKLSLESPACRPLVLECLLGFLYLALNCIHICVRFDTVDKGSLHGRRDVRVIRKVSDIRPFLLESLGVEFTPYLFRLFP